MTTLLLFLGLFALLLAIGGYLEERLSGRAASRKRNRQARRVR